MTSSPSEAAAHKAKEANLQQSILRTVHSCSLDQVKSVALVDQTTKDIVVDSIWGLLGIASDGEQERYSKLLDEVLNDDDFLGQTYSA